MKIFQYSSADFIYLDEGSVLRGLSKSKMTELSQLLVTDVVDYGGEGTVTINGVVCIKSNITALKLDANTYFTFIQGGSNSRWVLLNKDFDKITECVFHNNSAVLYKMSCIRPSDKCFLFQPTNGARYEHSVAVTFVRQNDGTEIPALLARSCDSQTISCYCSRGSEGFSTGQGAVSYNTLISLQKCIWPTMQLVCDYIFVPTHTGLDCAQKRFTLNGEEWIMTGESYSPGSYPYAILCAKLSGKYD